MSQKKEHILTINYWSIIGVSTVREILIAKSNEKAVITNQYFTQVTEKLTKADNVMLISRKKFFRIREYTKQMSLSIGQRVLSLLRLRTD
ncbi:hypothetical protein [Alkalihalobacillus sp. BA299]|uniref:hypothetical protein n=1 Tax=Alkalihalobacillus sp. BA299 TaxID=2815938 RepID=UPI001ADCC544|nr:hypothetical protein [Alkalihalobacillus sp. BA299]